MQFALVNNERTVPSPSVVGSCPVCGAPMISKCGDIRIHHWAHRGERVCDAWWERETEWHRAWKSRYPADWRERVLRDAGGQKHIADIHTARGLTIELQHSHIRLEERVAREAFYGNMVWVVDVARLKGDVPRFLEGISSFREFLHKGLLVTPTPEKAFPLAWLKCLAPVFFDFENTKLTDLKSFAKQSLWCLLPGRALGHAVVLRVSREDIIRWTHGRAKPIPTETIMDNVAASLLTEQQSRRELARVRAAQASQPAWLVRSKYRRKLAQF